MRIGKIIPIFARGNVYSSKTRNHATFLLFSKGCREFPDQDMQGGEPSGKSCLPI